MTVEQGRYRTPEQRSEGCDMYVAGASMETVAKKFDVTPRAVRGWLRKAAIALRPRRNPSGADHANWKGGRRVRSDGWVMLLTPTGERFEHRVVMERVLGRPLTQFEKVKHRDGNRQNNAPSNLFIKHGDVRQRRHERAATAHQEASHANG